MNSTIGRDFGQREGQGFVLCVWADSDAEFCMADAQVMCQGQRILILGNSRR